MRPIEDILADMQAIVDKPDLSAEDIASYLTLEAELAAAQASGNADPAPATEDEPEDNEPAAPVALTPAQRAIAGQIRNRHGAYTRVVVPAGRPSNKRRETEDDGFGRYLRTGQPNADLTRGPSNAQTTGTGSSGGYLVPEGFMNRVVEVIKTFGGVKRNVEGITTETGNPLPIPTNDDTANEGTVSAESTVPASGADLEFGQVQLSAYEYTASGVDGDPVKVPIALIQDSAIDFEARLAKALGTRIGRKMAKDAVTGSGSGQAQGVLQGLTGTELAANTGPAYIDLVNLIMSLDEAYWENGKLYMNRSSFGTVAQIEDGADQLIFRQGQMVGPSGEPVPALWIAGQLVPIVLDSAIGNITLTNGADDIWAIYGDLMEGYIWRDVRALEVLVNPYSSANKRQIEYNAWARADGRQKNTSAYKTLAGWTT